MGRIAKSEPKASEKNLPQNANLLEVFASPRVNRRILQRLRNRWAVNVPKRWVQVDGQRYLVEKIPLAELEPLFAQLAPPTRDLDLESKQSVYGRHWRPQPSLQRRQGEIILLAEHRTAEPGGMELIWDWEGINGSHTDKVFYGDTTYLVSDAVSLYGGNNVLEG